VADAAKPQAAIDIAVVGHTNAGKTSLLRTLTRQARFGEVSDRPGTTRHVQAIELEVDGQTLVRYFDTPGLEDSVALQHHLKQQPEALTPPQRVRALLDGPEARGVFEQEAKVLRQMLAADAAIYVIDCREPLLPKHRSEIEVLNTCARPIMPVLNFVRSANSREAEWREALAGHGLHAAVLFDAVAPFVGAERQLYEDLSVLMRQHKLTLQTVLRDLEHQAVERRAASAQRVADTLISAAAMRREIEPGTLADARAKAAFVQTFRDELVANVRLCVHDLLQMHGFAPDDATLDVAPWTSDRWASDLFNPETLATVGRLLGKGAAAGAAVGLTLDLALAGLSLGAGTALGAAIGGALSQGWGQAPRMLRNKLMGVEELTLDNSVLVLLADNLVHLCQVLQTRGHAAQDTIELRMAPSGSYRQAMLQLLEPLQQARAHPEWEQRAGQARDHSRRREELGHAIARKLNALLDTAPAAPGDGGLTTLQTVRP
jgi:tRNA isopentenyl-2-thiomethyl-A-37 hydroxylase MiaE